MTSNNYIYCEHEWRTLNWRTKERAILDGDLKTILLQNALRVP
ncbi:hypothetical protein N8E89_26110 (plasmid) [Phyllobacterium sp. A18/5-2]|nr:hypothetical protein [Phyllobacterium sp. A18/5-2]UXN66565.1 hypothetical protein N8E89_26110 [Phyllobacterium sp. A18/5-2]